MTRYSPVLSIAISVLLIASVGLASAQTQEDTPTVSDFLPSFEGFRWRVTGFADYGHEMEIAAISVNQDEMIYEIQGEVDDLSGGESGRDYSFSVSYIVGSDKITQVTDGETLLDSRWDTLELLRAPIEEGASWQQDVGQGGGATTLRCTIEAIEDERGERTLTILYRDVEGSYYERREIREHIGVVGFERLMPDEEEPYEVSYTVFPGATLLPPTVDFVDVTSKAWFLSYFGAPQRMELIQGYPDGTFRPDRSISVAEFVKTIVGARGYRIANEEEPWYRPYIGIAEERELVRSGEFEGYDRPIRREEMAMLLARAAGTQPVDGGDFEGFSDSDEIGSYFQSYVTQATEHGLLTGYPDGSFRPGEAMTRAEAARVLWSLIHVIDHPILRPEGTLELEEEFQDRLYQDTIRDEDDPLPRVEDFDRMEDVIDHLAEIMNRDLASSYVEDYYEERSGRLYLIPMDGPTLLREDEDFQLRMITPTQYELVQDTSTELVGDYILTIEYRRKDDRWIIFDREVTLEG